MKQCPSAFIPESIAGEIYLKNLAEIVRQGGFEEKEFRTRHYARTVDLTNGTDGNSTRKLCISAPKPIMTDERPRDPLEIGALKITIAFFGEEEN